LELDFIFWLIAKLLRFKIVYTAHNILPHEKKAYHRYLFKVFYCICDAIIVTSSFAGRQLETEFGIKSDKISVIPIGYAGPPVLPILSREEARESLAIQSNAKLILFFGLVREYKGIDTLIKAVQIARDKIGDLRLLIAGDCSSEKLQQKYCSLVQELGIQEAVDMRIGFVSDQDLPKYIGASDIVVLPYKRASGHSGILFLAYHFSRPVIATKVGGLIEAVKEGKSGYLVPPEDENALANAIIEAFADRQKLFSMGNYGRQTYEEIYSWDKIARATVEAYYRLVMKKRDQENLGSCFIAKSPK
jgi:glycosyltransferase involved in cell wall biosynthesis